MKPLTVTAEHEGNSVRVVFEGELDIGGAAQAEDVLAQAEGDSVTDLTLDLSGLTFMDSTGLRLVVAANRRAQESGRTLRVVRGPAAVQRVFELTGLDDKLPLVDG